MAAAVEAPSGGGRTFGLVVAGIAGGSALAFSLIAIPFVTPALRRVCIPYVPATPAQLANLSRALDKTRLSSHALGPLVDLGSGDGRVVSAHEQGVLCCR